MENIYLKDCERPAHDVRITEWLAVQENDSGITSYKIALFHDGYLYRSISCTDLAEYVAASEFLKSLTLVNCLDSTATFRGFDAVFATLQDYKKAFPARQPPL
ncbi:hypothetical protein ACNY67_01035 [Pantoea sp. KXB45]|uniref:hypothetical protein n=1 Tax=Pantoea sp. KXB45 TaxID=3402309 RepID=UPI003AB10EBC